jgi:hypothetical protein
VEKHRCVADGGGGSSGEGWNNQRLHKIVVFLSYFCLKVYMVCRVRYCFLNIYDREIRLHNIMHRIPPNHPPSPHCTHCIATQALKSILFSSQQYFMENAYLIILMRLFCQMGRCGIYTKTERDSASERDRRR